MKKYDVTALGELLIDFTENGLSGQNNILMEANPGGAPCNVLAMLSKLGKKTAFIGKVGDDYLGHHLAQVTQNAGIDISNLLFDKEVHTTLAFVHTFADGDRDFSFYRNPGADMMLKESEINEEIIAASKLFHFGTLSMTNPEVKKATQKAVKIARDNNCLISFDPNLRPPLWQNLDDAKEAFDYGMKNCDILKISDNELLWFTGTKDFDSGIKILKEKYNIPLILLSKGKEGSSAYYKDLTANAAAFLDVPTIETTGAGDTFFACIINYILEHGLTELNQTQLLEMLNFANAAAAIITTRKGALKVMPEKNEIEALLSKK